MSFFRKLLGLQPKADFKELVNQKALIVDVRTPKEFQSGHIKGSKNIPLDRLKGSLDKLPSNKPIITCCASGIRSMSAKSILKSNGFSEVYNGGGWQKLQAEIR